MTSAATLAIVLLVAAGSAGAHAPDEYVQALQVAVMADGIGLYLALTPGIEVAHEVIAQLDQDDDGRISVPEAEAYGRLVLAELSVSLDGSSRSVRLTRVETPAVGELADGDGTIRIDSTLAVSASTGPHTIVVRNAHHQARSVYLANAMLPASTEVSIVRQRRDWRQQVFELDYEVHSLDLSSGIWGVTGALLLLGPLGWRARRLLSQQA